MTAPATTAWFLLTVMGNTVNPSHGFESRHLCEEGRSLFLYGQSIEDKKAADAKAVDDEKLRAAAFVKANPPRPPRGDTEKKLVAKAKRGEMDFSGSECTYNVHQVVWKAWADGLMHAQDGPDCYIGTMTTEPYKTAYCVPDDSHSQESK